MQKRNKSGRRNISSSSYGGSLMRNANNNKLFVNGNTLSVTGEKIRLVHLPLDRNVNREIARKYSSSKKNLKRKENLQEIKVEEAESNNNNLKDLIEKVYDEQTEIDYHNHHHCDKGVIDDLIVTEKSLKRLETSQTSTIKKKRNERVSCRLTTRNYVNPEVCTPQLKDIYESIEIEDFKRILNNFRAKKAKNYQLKTVKASHNKPICIDASTIYLKFFQSYYEQFKDLIGDNRRNSLCHHSIKDNIKNNNKGFRN